MIDQMNCVSDPTPLIATQSVPSPKRPRKSSGIGADWYDYYAGYSPAFVEATLRGLSLSANATVCDPWIGAGTTAQVAQRLGLRCRGFDLNPAMVVVAKAQLLGTAIEPSETALCETILEMALSKTCDPQHADDPLSVWFHNATVHHIRRIECAIQHALLPDADRSAYGKPVAVSNLSTVASFFYLALFRTVRSLLLPFFSSNPTWIKQPRDQADKLIVLRPRIVDEFRSNIQTMISSRSQLNAFEATSGRLTSNTIQSDETDEYAHQARIEVASSEALPCDPNSLDAVIGSPPYCTRIDYAVATLPELAVLGLSEKDIRKVRESLIGTSTVSGSTPKRSEDWGRLCAAFLGKVAAHSSKASSGYYLKTHLQYFDAFYRSLQQIGAALKVGGPCVLVVQDSFYKEVRNDLAGVTIEMATGLGWNLLERHDFAANHLMARVHKAGRQYRKSTKATESVLVFET